MTASYDQWRRWLAGEDRRNYVRGLQAGFYRVRFGVSDEFFPLAIFELDGMLVGLLCGDIHSEDELNELDVWPRAARHPITEAEYRAVAERREPWPSRKPNDRR